MRLSWIAVTVCAVLGCSSSPGGGAGSGGTNGSAGTQAGGNGGRSPGGSGSTTGGATASGGVSSGGSAGITGSGGSSNTGGTAAGGASGGQCRSDADCVACAYTSAPTSAQNCYCAQCATRVLDKTTCDANQAAWTKWCSNVNLRCPAILCVRPPIPACVNGTCTGSPAP